VPQEDKNRTSRSGATSWPARVKSLLQNGTRSGKIEWAAGIAEEYHVAMQVSSGTTPDRTAALVLFLAALLSYACFSQSTENPNTRTRMFLTLALIQDGSTKIDGYHEYTLDRAVFADHYYSEKAPGLSFAAIPAVAAGLWVIGRDVEMFDAQGNATVAFERLTYLSILATSGVFGALAVLAVYLLSIEFGVGRSGAGFAAIALAWGTPLWGWATAFLGHAMTAGCLSLGLLMLVRATRDHPPGWPGRSLLAGVSGALLAWAVVVEFTAAGAVALFLAFGAWRAWRLPVRQRIWLAAATAISALIFLAPLFIYNASSFGSPWHFGYTYTESWYPAMKEGFVGFSVPSLSVMGELLFGRYRGIAWVSPLSLAAYGAGFWLVFRSSAEIRPAILLCLFIALYYLVLNSSYAYWDGGWSSGPRHLTASLPLLALPLGLAWRDSPALLRAFLAALLLTSIALSLMWASTSMFAPDFFKDALNIFLLPSFEARLAGAPVPRIGAFAFVAPWELPWPRPVALWAVALIPAIASACVAWRLRSSRPGIKYPAQDRNGAARR
jgi:hypothetical protein